MATILADSFTRSGATLGAGWTESAGSNFSTDGTQAQIDATGLHIGTVDASSQTNQYVQCWLRVPDVNQNSGICWRYQSATMFYVMVGLTSGFSMFRRDGSGFNLIATSASTLPANTYVKVGVRMVGTQIDFYYSDAYNTTLEGPNVRVVDSGITGAGTCGIITTGNNATGASGPLWDGFHCFDDTGETIYVEVSATGQSLGTQADPDGSLQMGTNCVGLHNNGSVLQILTEGSTPIGPPGAGLLIGHAGKFALNASEAFPTYSDEDGTEVIANAANLTIQGVSSGTRTILRNTNNGAFIQVRNDATYVLVRGLDYDCTGGSSSGLISTISTNNLGAGTEHSVAVHKCEIQLATAAANDTTGLSVGTDATVAEMRYCYGTVRAAKSGSDWFQILSGSTVDSVIVRRNLFTGDVRRCVFLQDGPATGKTWNITHNTYVDNNSASHTNACLEVADGADVVGDIYHENCIMVSRGANSTDFGTEISSNPGSVSGTVTAQYNGYFQMGANRGTGVTEGASELEALDPVFNDEGTPYLWPESAQSPGIILAADWRPTDENYLGTANDTYAGVTLDRGALEDYTIPPTDPPSFRTGLERVMLLTGDMSSFTPYTTESKTVKIVSEHFDNGPANRVIHPQRFQVKYVPTAGDVVRLSWRTDRNVTHGATIDLNPFSYSTFLTLPERGDFYVYEDDMPCEPGKALEITITTSSQVENHILGLNVAATFSDGAAYIGGVA